MPHVYPGVCVQASKEAGAAKALAQARQTVAATSRIMAAIDARSPRSARGGRVSPARTGGIRPSPVASPVVYV